MRKRGGACRALVFACAALIGLLGVLTVFVPSSDFSIEEKRSLMSWSALSVDDIASGSFPSKLSRIYEDQFTFRLSFCRIKAMSEYLLGKRENNGIIFGSDGYLIDRCAYDNLEIARENLEALKSFSASADIPVSVMLAPRSIDVMSGCLPPLYDTAESAAVLELVNTTLPSANIPLEELRSAAELGRQVQYRTDHHWTTRGAYIAYVSFAEDLSIMPYPEEYFDICVSDTDFCGTSYSSAGCICSQSDTVELWRYAKDSEYTVLIEETGEQRSGFYDFESCGYDIFLGGNFGRLSIRCESEEEKEPKPRLLLIKDSYANSLIPFLALHFELDVIDLRYYAGNISDIVSLGDHDRVLVVQGIDTVATEASVKKIVR